MSSKSKANKGSKQPQEQKQEPKATPQPEPEPQPEVVSVVLTRKKVYPDGGVSYSVPGMKGIVAFKPNVLIPGALTPETLTLTFPAGFDFIRQPMTGEKPADSEQAKTDEQTKA